MTPEHDARLRFRQWLIEHDLEPEVAYAILETMPPFDWSEIARRDEMLLCFSDVDERFAIVDQRFDAVDQRFDAVDKRFDALDRRLDRMDQRFDGIDHRFDGLEAQFGGLEGQFGGLVAKFDGLQSNIEGQLVAMEGRLSLRWMETTRLIVLAMMTLFLGFVGVGLGLLQA